MRNLIPVVLGLAVVAHGVALSGFAPFAGASAAAAARDTARVRLGPPQAGGTDAFVVWPTGREPAPAVVVVHEAWGMNGHIRAVARRLAQEGYVVIVPDLFRGPVTDDPGSARELALGVDEERALDDLAAAVAWLRGESRVVGARVGVLGLGMGGRLAELYALRDSTLAAAVMFYGGPETDPAKVAALRVPLQAHFGEADPDIGAGQVEALRAALAQSGNTADVYVYPGAGNAFLNASGPSYHRDAARQAWARMLQFLQKLLKG